jgi:type IV pilus assembly protein PilQ
LSYAKAKDVAVQLAATASGTGTNANSSRVLSARGSAVAEPRTNQLFVTDVPSKLEEVQQMIIKLDIPVRQVLIEARIVEASDSFGRSLGVKLGSADLRAQQGGDGGYSIGGGNNRVAFGTNYGNAVASSGAGGTVDLTSGFVNLPAIGAGIYSPATFALSIFSSAANRFLNLELSALESDGNGKVVSNPRIVTADQIPALISQGVQLPYTKAGTNGAEPTTEFADANLKLEVTPQITPDGSILLDVDITKDTPGVLTAAGYAINTKHIKTQILVENGGTVVIGGIFTMDESDEVTKVPLLGDLPGVGHLFKSRTRSTEKQEMLVFITPKMVSEKAVR